MAAPLVIEEQVIDATVAYIQEQLPAALDELNESLDPRQRVTMFHKIYDDIMEPSTMGKLPAASVWIDQSEDEIKDRALTLNTCSVRVLFAWYGHGKIGYRFGAALTSIFLRDPTFTRRIGRARVTERKYYTPVADGELEIRVAEIDLEIKQEVQRT